MVGSRPSSCSSFFETLRSLRHRLDHVDRDADRAGLVGDGPRDRLADPPGRVGAELVAAAILVLVHRPHQAGVAFLDQVQEAQAAVAVLLGDRDHQPQVAAGQVALGLLVLGEALPDDLDALAEAGRLLQRVHHVVVQFLLEVGPVFLAAARSPLQLPRSAASSSSIRAEICSSFFISGWTFCVRIDSSSTSVTALRRRTRSWRRSVRRVVLGGARVEDLGEVLLVLLHQVFQRPQVVRHPLEDLVLFQVLRQRHLDGAVERQVAGVDALERSRPPAAGRRRTPAPCGGSACG